MKKDNQINMNTNYVWVQYQCVDSNCHQCCDVKIRDKLMAGAEPIACPFGRGAVKWKKVWDSTKRKDLDNIVNQLRNTDNK